MAVVVQIMGSFPLHRHTPVPRGTTLSLTPLGSVVVWAMQPGSRKLLDTPYHPSPALGEILTWRGWEGVFICEVGAGLKTTGAV